MKISNANNLTPGYAGLSIRTKGLSSSSLPKNDEKSFDAISIQSEPRQIAEADICRRDLQRTGIRRSDPGFGRQTERTKGADFFPYLQDRCFCDRITDASVQGGG